MMTAALLLTAAQVGPPVPTDLDLQRYDKCIDLATTKPGEAVAAAAQWRAQGGGYLAQQCLGMAYAGQQKWTDAAEAFEVAAREGAVAHESRTANYWAQAGNAWALAGEFAKARTALDSAISAGTLRGLDLGEAYLDRARVRVVQADLPGARQDMDEAVNYAADDPLAWLLSATLARRMNDVGLARRHINEALKRSPDDASVQLEAGNVAALEKNEKAAREAWTAAMNLAPGTDVAIAARAALKQFGPDAPKP